MRTDEFVYTTFLLVGLAVFVAFSVHHSYEGYQVRLDTDIAISSLKNRWCQMNDELQTLKKENEKLRRDVRRIKAGRVNQEDSE